MSQPIPTKKNIMSTTEERLNKIENIFLKKLYSKLISNINIIFLHWQPSVFPKYKAFS